MNASVDVILEAFSHSTNKEIHTIKINFFAPAKNNRYLGSLRHMFFITCCLWFPRFLINESRHRICYAVCDFEVMTSVITDIMKG